MTLVSVRACSSYPSYAFVVRQTPSSLQPWISLPTCLLALSQGPGEGPHRDIIRVHLHHLLHMMIILPLLPALSPSRSPASALLLPCNQAPTSLQGVATPRHWMVGAVRAARLAFGQGCWRWLMWSQTPRRRRMSNNACHTGLSRELHESEETMVGWLLLARLCVASCPYAPNWVQPLLGLICPHFDPW